jgi:pimeloyl-ACP methyl ester carboxylesterase
VGTVGTLVAVLRGWALRYRFDAASALGKVRCPVLVLHSPQDKIIPTP